MRIAPVAVLVLFAVAPAFAQTAPAPAAPPPANVPAPPPSAPSTAKPIFGGGFKDWYVYSFGSGSSRVCYALAKPASMAPKNVTRDPAYFIIGTWPGQNIVNQPSVIPGYPYKDDGKVQARVGSDKFDFFTQNDGTNGGAWVKTTADETRLTAAMKKGSQMIVTGLSQRGTLTTDTYSLSGISAALDKVAEVCK